MRFSGKVDGKPLFNLVTDAMISVRRIGEYEDIAFYLNNVYNWEIKTDSYGVLCLIPTRK